MSCNCTRTLCRANHHDHEESCRGRATRCTCSASICSLFGLPPPRQNAANNAANVNHRPTSESAWVWHDYGKWQRLDGICANRGCTPRGRSRCTCAVTCDGILHRYCVTLLFAIPTSGKDQVGHDRVARNRRADRTTISFP